MKGHLTMSNTELDRLQILQKIMEHRKTQAAAAQALGLSHRQVKRLMARFRQQAATGLVSAKRGKQGNRRLPTLYTEHVLDLVREH
jgi:molybdenum-dependent DNA-binding transcriptional regulator ModE